jgi:bud site selection protein 20
MGVGNKRTRTKTRNKLRDIDQIKADLTSPKHLKQYQETKAPEDLPGLGKWYCTECAKWYETETSLIVHRRGKPHKRRYA